MITLTSHHDSVPGAPGANDNASGTAMVLELARVLKNLPTDTEVRFITFGAEELGLIAGRGDRSLDPLFMSNRFRVDLVAIMRYCHLSFLVF